MSGTSSPTYLWVEGDFDGHLSGHGPSTATATGTRRHGLACVDGRLRNVRVISGPPGVSDDEEPAPIRLALAPHVWVERGSNWYEVTLQDFCLRDYRQRLAEEAGARSVIRVEGRLVARLVREVPPPVDVGPAVERARGCLLVPLSSRAGCLPLLGLGLGLFGLVFWLCSVPMAMLFLAMLAALWSSSRWPPTRVRVTSVRNARLIAGGALAALAALLLFLWGRWLDGPCEPLGWATLIALVVLPLVVATQGRRWLTTLALVLFASSLPPLCAYGSGCDDAPLGAMRRMVSSVTWRDVERAWHTPAPQDPGGTAVAEATRGLPSARRISLEEAQAALDQGRPLCDVPLVASGDFLFDADADQLHPEALRQLQRLRASLRNAPDLALTVDGHADRIHGMVDNQELSERRAKAVAEVFAGVIPHDKLETRGHGDREPVVDDRSNPSLAHYNRRVELTLHCPPPASAPATAGPP